MGLIRRAHVLVLVSLLTACTALPSAGDGSRYRCDRNGDNEQRVAC